MRKRGRGHPRSGQGRVQIGLGNLARVPGRSNWPRWTEVRTPSNWFIPAASRKWSRTTRRAWSSGRPVIPRRRTTPCGTRFRLAPRTSGSTSRWGGSLLMSSKIRSSPAGILATPWSWHARSCQRVSRAAYRAIVRRTHRFTTPSKVWCAALRPGHAPRGRESDHVRPETSGGLIAWVVLGPMCRQQGA